MRQTFVGLVLIVAIGTGLAVLSRHVAIFQSDHALWSAGESADDPLPAKALINLAVDAMQREDYPAARQYLQRAGTAAVGPDGPVVVQNYLDANWTSFYLRQGELEQARTFVRQSPKGSLARTFCPQYPTLQLCEDAR